MIAPPPAPAATYHPGPLSLPPRAPDDRTDAPRGPALRVAAVIQSYLPVLGGAQTQVQQLGPLFARQGVETVVLTRRVAGTPALERGDGLLVRRLWVPEQSSAASLAYLAEGVAGVLRWRPHVIHVHDLLSPASIGLLSARLLRVPVVALVASTGPGGDIDRLLHKPPGARRLRRIVTDVAAFHTLADEVEDELTGHGVPADRLWRIPNGVDTERFRPGSGDERRTGRERLGIPPDAVVSIYCGRFAPVKRLDVLLDAFRDAPGHLVLVGNGSEEDVVLGRAREAGLAGRVHVLPAVDDPAPLLRAADLYVSASSTEGMSNSVLEAMASGLPIVASPASGMGEIVTAATGVLADDTGPARLGAAIATVAGDGRLREQRGAAARELIASRYSLQSTADLLVALYRRLAATHPRRAREATTVPPAA